ncbi:hypothetical protein EIP91_009399 [Steccherinum ochraceum]|uniref:Uncharacterized protein n=1 Tax=Steccherinum ochraceum TaxID=92696 RepID=A0A4R0R1N5_9APHY|nr:hypothetical protein EIP91_009399 [Steccherinum ochraceum]
MDSLFPPNPLAPLAWVNSNVAAELQITRYVLSAAAGAWVWDNLMSLPDLIRMYSASSPKPPDVVQTISRIASGTFIFAALMLNVVPVDNCEAMAKAVGWTAAITLPLHTLPFFFCVKAVFYEKKLVIAAFAVSCIATIGASLTSPFFIHASPIDPTQECLVDTGMAYSAGIVAVAVNNGATFFAVSFHLSLYSQAETWSGRIKAFCRKRGMGEVSRLLLETGQLYVIPIVLFNIAAAIVNVIPSIPSLYRLLFVVLSVTVQSCMTSRIHRQIKLGLMNTHPTSVRTSVVDRSLQFQRSGDARVSSMSQSQSYATQGTRNVVRAWPDPGARVIALSTPREKMVELDAIAESRTSEDDVMDITKETAGSEVHV